MLESETSLGSKVNTLLRLNNPTALFTDPVHANAFCEACLLEAQRQSALLPPESTLDEFQLAELMRVRQQVAVCDAAKGHAPNAASALIEVYVAAFRARVSEAGRDAWIEQNGSLTPGDKGGMTAREWLAQLLQEYDERGWLRPLSAWTQ